MTPEKAKKKGPKPGPKSSKKGFELEANGDVSPSTSKEDGSPGKAKKNNMCGSGYPTYPKFLPPTLNFFSKF